MSCGFTRFTPRIRFASCVVVSIGLASTIARAICRALVESIDQIGGAGAVRPHAHIQRRFESKGKTAAGVIELHRRHAEVRDETADRADVRLLQNVKERFVTSLYERHAIRESPQPLPRE